MLGSQSDLYLCDNYEEQLLIRDCGPPQAGKNWGFSGMLSWQSASRTQITQTNDISTISLFPLFFAKKLLFPLISDQGGGGRGP